MNLILSGFIIILSLTVYPAILVQNSELLYIFNFLEFDFFNWYRMLLVAPMAAFLFCRRVEWPIVLFLICLFLSSIFSKYPETVLYGTPMHHEGVFAILGYIGIYQLAVYTGISRSVEKSLSAVVYITAFIACLQLYYGNFLNFPFFKIFIPEVPMRAEVWPIYANLGGPNNLGLFCSLVMPYALIRRKWLQFFLLSALLIGCQARGAWLSVFLTTAFISKKCLLFIILLALCLSVFKHDLIKRRVLHTINNIHFPPEDGDLAGRIYMWKRAVPFLKNSILIGRGPATYIHDVPQFHPRGDAIGFFNHAVDRPHNTFINIWHGTGLLSLLTLAYWIIGKLRIGADASLKMGVIGYLIASVFTDSVLCVTPYFLIFLGGINGSNNEARRFNQREE